MIVSGTAITMAVDPGAVIGQLKDVAETVRSNTSLSDAGVKG